MSFVQILRHAHELPKRETLLQLEDHGAKLSDAGGTA